MEPVLHTFCNMVPLVAILWSIGWQPYRYINSKYKIVLQHAFIQWLSLGTPCTRGALQSRGARMLSICLMILVTLLGGNGAAEKAFFKRCKDIGWVYPISIIMIISRGNCNRCPCQTLYCDFDPYSKISKDVGIGNPLWCCRTPNPQEITPKKSHLFNFNGFSNQLVWVPA